MSQVSVLHHLVLFVNLQGCIEIFISCRIERIFAGINSKVKKGEGAMISQFLVVANFHESRLNGLLQAFERFVFLNARYYAAYISNTSNATVSL